MTLIAQGAEAIITLSKNKVIKDRISKSYRIKELDEKIRRQRTKKEVKLLEKASNLIPVPEIISSDKYQIELEFIKGKKLSDCLDSLKNKEEICIKTGENTAKLHDSNIIHGDLTTSNMLLKKQELFFIDFGLGFESNKDEDKAVDLHVLKEALEARHFNNSKRFWQKVLKGYNSSKNSKNVLKRLETVEKRGRYKQAN